MVHKSMLALAPLFVLALVSTPAVAAAQSLYLEVEISLTAPGSTETVVQVKPFAAPQWSLAERAAVQSMWNGMEFQLTPVARDCQMPIAIQIDAGSFRGHFVPGTADGLQPGTRGRFHDFARAMTAVCGRGDMERSAFRGAIRTVQIGFTESPVDVVQLRGGALIYRTNGDLTGDGHLGYAQMIDWLINSL